MQVDVLIVIVGALATAGVGVIIRVTHWGMKRAIEDVVKETLMKPNGGNSLYDIRSILDKQTLAQEVMGVRLEQNKKSHEALAKRIEGISRHLIALEARFDESGKGRK